jgi:hypothetical protein
LPKIRGQARTLFHAQFRGAAAGAALQRADTQSPNSISPPLNSAHRAFSALLYLVLFGSL